MVINFDGWVINHGQIHTGEHRYGFGPGKGDGGWFTEPGMVSIDDGIWVEEFSAKTMYRVEYGTCDECDTCSDVETRLEDIARASQIDPPRYSVGLGGIECREWAAMVLAAAGMCKCYDSINYDWSNNWMDPQPPSDPNGIRYGW